MTAANITTFDFMPHGHCFFWQKDILFLHVASDTVIATAYFSIPFALVYLAKKRPDLKFRNVFMMFAAFILACGITHLLNIWNFWHADYWIAGLAKAATGIISLATAIFLWRLMPTLMNWPSPVLLEKLNHELREEINLRKEQEIQLQEAFDNAPIGKALVGLDGAWIKVNPALCHILGYTAEELKTMNFQQITYEDDLDSDLDNVRDLLNGVRDSYQMEKRYKHKAGNLVWALLSVTIVRDDQNVPQYFISQILDITYRKLTEAELRESRAQLELRVAERTKELEELNKQLQEKNEQLKAISVTDQLTGLHNRHSLSNELDKLRYDSHRYDTEFTIMLIDVDNFKQINDTYGHVQGDEVLQKLADDLKLNLRKTDFAARFGGDEFCVLLPYTSMNNAPEIAEHIRQLVESRDFIADNGDHFKITLSIGLAEYKKDILKDNDLISWADQALYKAKQNGRNRVEVFKQATR